MQKKWLLACWSGILAVSGTAQTTLSSAEVLASARRDLSVELQGRQLDFARQNAARLPFVEQVGLRTETDRFDWQRQEFLARMNVNGLKEIRQQDRYRQSGQWVEESRYQGLLHEALAERYAALVQYRQLQRQTELQRRLLQVYEDEINVLQKRAALNAGTDLAEIIKAEFDRDELALQLAGTSDRLRQLRSAIGVLAQLPSDAWELDTAGFVRPGQLGAIAAGPPVLLLSSPGLAEQEAKIARLEAGFALEKAQAQQVLDFVQLRHNNRPDDPFGQNLSIGLGINLPFKGTSKYKMATLKIEKSAAVFELEQERTEREREIEAARAELAALESRRQLALRQLENSQAEFTLRQAADGRAADALVLLRAKELQLKRERQLLDIEGELYELYLYLLDRSGQLSAAPAVNYLSATGSGF